MQNDVAALFVEPAGVYSKALGVDLWTEDRDARAYKGPLCVVAHPPCNRWVNLAGHNYIRYTREKGRPQPHLRPGNDGGCFAHALGCVQRFGGVLEHPAGSHAWSTFGLRAPVKSFWLRDKWNNGWVTEVYQSAYGHPAQKRTWLFYCGRQPLPLRWEQPSGTHQVGWYDRAKPTLSKKAAIATPPDFAEELLQLARYSNAS